MPRYERSVLLGFRSGTGGGTAGLHPVNADQYGAAFDPVWGGEAIFHDVFEHWQEGEQYFDGPLAMNLGGEMAASGSLYYYHADLGIQRFGGANQDVTAETAVNRNTRDLLLEAWTDGMRICRPPSISPRHGLILRSGVPAQAPPDPPSQLDAVLERYWQGIEAHAATVEHRPVPKEVLEFRDSVTRERVFDLHRWGWHEAQRMVPLVSGNRDRLDAFIDFWNRYCATHAADELMDAHQGIRFSIRHDGGVVGIDAGLVDRVGAVTPVPGWS